MSLCRPQISYGMPLDTIRNATAKSAGLWYVQMKQYLRIDTSESKTWSNLISSVWKVLTSLGRVKNCKTMKGDIIKSAAM
jgi:hypothetical protein